MMIEAGKDVILTIPDILKNKYNYSWQEMTLSSHATQENQKFTQDIYFGALLRVLLSYPANVEDYGKTIKSYINSYKVLLSKESIETHNPTSILFGEGKYINLDIVVNCLLCRKFDILLQLIPYLRVTDYTKQILNHLNQSQTLIKEVFHNPNLHEGSYKLEHFMFFKEYFLGEKGVLGVSPMEYQIFIYIQNNQFINAEYMLCMGTPFNLVDSNNKGILHYLSALRNSFYLQHFISLALEFEVFLPYTQTKTGMKTPLHVAVKYNLFENVKILLDNYNFLLVFTRDRKGRTSIEYAKVKGLHKMAEFLGKYVELLRNKTILALKKAQGNMALAVNKEGVRGISSIGNLFPLSIPNIADPLMCELLTNYISNDYI